MRNKVILIISLFLCLNISIQSGGFQINEHSARAMALGGAFTAIVDDVSAIYFNPAGLTNLSGFNMMAGTTLIVPTSSFRGPAPSITEHDMKSLVFYPSHAYFSYQLTDDLHVGLGVNNPFGLGTEWDDDWVGRFVSVKVDLKTFSFSPTLSYKINDMLSVGATFQYNYAEVEIVRAKNLAPFDAEAMITLDGQDKAGIGYTGGILFKPTDKLSFGLTYKSEVAYEFDGTAESEVAEQLKDQLPHGDIKAELTTPMQVIFGVSYKALCNLNLSADFQYIGWSSYDYLRASYPDGSSIIDSKRDYENTYIARLGAEYTVNDQIALQGGLLYDNNPVPDEYLDASLADSDRLGFSAGFTYKLTKCLDVSASYLFLRFNERTVDNSLVDYSGGDGLTPFNGTYNSVASLFGFSISYSL